MRAPIIAIAVAAAALGTGLAPAQEGGEREELEEALAYGLSLSNEEWLSLIPKRSRGIFWTTCPHCQIRTRTARWSWTPKAPKAITCEDCHTRFPDPRYPENGEVVIKAPDGGAHRFTYYQSPKPAAPDFKTLPKVWEQVWTDQNDLDKGAWRLFPADPSGKSYRSEVSADKGMVTIHRGERQGVTLSRALERDLLPKKGAFYMQAELQLPPGQAADEAGMVFGLEPWVQVQWGRDGLRLKGLEQVVPLPGEAGKVVTLRFKIRPQAAQIEAVWLDGEPVPLASPLRVKQKKDALPTLFLSGATGSSEALGLGRLEIRTSPESKGPAGLPIQYFLSSTADYHSRKYVVDETARLARLFEITKEEKLAERIAITLEEFAKVYPGYPYIYDGSWHGKPVELYPYDEPVIQPGNRPSRWEYWGYMDLSMELLNAYRAVESWSGWNGQQRVVEDLFRRQIADVNRFPETYHNMSVARKWPSLLLAGRVLHDPELFHDTYRRLEHFVTKDFLYDGYWKETSPSYAAMSNGGLMRIARYIDGYSDPEGYRDPVSGKRFDAIDSDKALPGAAALRETLNDARFPDGRYLPINDTWGSSKPSLQAIPVVRKAGLFPGFGLALLQTRAGVPFSVYLNFTSGQMHKQFDTLAIGLFAQDKEYLSTIGYTHTRYRPWAKSAISKNTVIVDGREPELDRNHVGNRLLLFAADEAPEALFSLAAAQSLSAYPNRTSRYERYLALISDPKDPPYLIDIFHVKGGQQHDYLLHSSVDEDSEAELEGEMLQPFSGSLMNPGVKFVPPVIEGSNIGGPEAGYGFVKNLRQSQAKTDGVSLLFRYRERDRGFRSRLLSQKGDHYFLGEGPSVRRAGGRHFKENEQLLDRDHAPMLCWRRSGADLESTFIAIHQLLKDPALQVERLATVPGIIALRLDRGASGVDYYLQSFEPSVKAEINTPEGKLVFQGLAGFLSVREGRAQNARLIGKGELRLGKQALEQPDGEHNGAVMAFGNSPQPFLDIQETIALPPGKHAVKLTFPDGTERSFNLLAAQPSPSGNGTRLRVKEQMGFERDNGKIVFTSFPQREASGENIVYTLPLMKSASWADAEKN